VNRSRPATWAFALLACLSIVDVAAARADTTVTLQGVTFADGATASGYFLLNVYGYVDGAAITTTPGTSMGGISLPGYTYTSGGVATAPTPFDTLFYFNSTVDAFSLALEVADPLVPGYSGFDSLVAGSGSGASLAGSIETCQENSQACGGPNYLDGRLVIAGTLYAPEPATLTLLGVGAGLLPIVRRKPVRAKGGDT
jgi:hypothetical protein